MGGGARQEAAYFCTIPPSCVAKIEPVEPGRMVISFRLSFSTLSGYRPNRNHGDRTHQRQCLGWHAASWSEDCVGVICLFAFNGAKPDNAALTIAKSLHRHWTFADFD
jgi:hypothetical protein